ncbi:MAG: hypothetical protein FJ088_07405 [Deltaproteobacteria bacterium]|nr:hypothetical protein [Deltaproteobacteria bacterium]
MNHSSYYLNICPPSRHQSVPCKEDKDCDVGMKCKEIGDETCPYKECAIDTCFGDEDCPEGWSCRMAPTMEVIFICVPPNPMLCGPCETNMHCGSFYYKNDLCVSYGKKGFFCGVDCEFRECPHGYKCEYLIAVGGEIGGWQCVEENGECHDRKNS